MENQQESWVDTKKRKWLREVDTAWLSPGYSSTRPVLLVTILGALLWSPAGVRKESETQEPDKSRRSTQSQ